jgi:hypothetical protein
MSKNVNAKLSKNNIYIKTCFSVRQTFNKLFENSVNEYNGKQKRNDRKIQDYYEKILESGNGEKPTYEYVIQFGDMNDTNVNNTGGDAEMMKELLIEMAEEFEQDYPNFVPISSVIHVDEQTPHWHITFVPVATGYKTGMTERCSYTKACANMGLDKYETVNAEGQKVEHYNYEAFLASVYEKMERKLESRGYSRDFKNNKEKHLDVNAFKNKREVDAYNKREKEAIEKEKKAIAKREAAAKAREAENKVEYEALKLMQQAAIEREQEAENAIKICKKIIDALEEVKLKKAAATKLPQMKSKPPIDRKAEVERLVSTINYDAYTTEGNSLEM